MLTDEQSGVTKESRSAASRNTLTAIIMLITAAGFANAFGVWFVYDLDWYTNEPLVSFLIGGLIAQPCLLATWAGLSNQTALKRYSISLAVLIGLTFSYLGFMNFLDNGLPVEVAAIILTISVLLYLFPAGMMHLYRWKSGKSLELHEKECEEPQSNQFAISHLLIATAVISVLIAIAKWAFPTGGSEGAAAAQWLEIMSFLALFFLLATSIYLTMTLASFQKSTVLPGLVAVVLQVIFGSFAVNLIRIWNFSGFREFMSSVVNTFCFCSGLLLFQLAVLLIFRSLGFRLRDA